jgi:hypothetical protein
MSTVNDWFQEHRIKFIDTQDDVESFCIMKEPLRCQDGFTMSVQASYYHYCTPRITLCSHYSEFEVGFPSQVEDLLMPWAEDPEKPTETVYGCVPEEVIDQVIEKHGGIA